MSVQLQKVNFRDQVSNSKCHDGILACKIAVCEILSKMFALRVLKKNATWDY